MDRPSAMQNRRAGCCNSRPWILIDSIARTGYCSNGTTARTLTSRGFPVMVSFDLADPPGVSVCFVHCPGPKNSHFNGDPLVLTTSQAFLLLVISFTSSANNHKNAFAFDDNQFDDYFVYTAGPGRPRLDRIQMPSPRDYEDMTIGILPLCDDGHNYAVVVPNRRYNRASHSASYNLRVFWSDRKVWTAKGTLMARDSETKVLNHAGTRVVSVGGDVLGWVDLWWGILLCRVLDETPLMRLVQWPVPEPRVEFDHISPRPFRDVAVVNGMIKFVELKFQEPTVNQRGVNEQGWTTTIWKRMVSSVDWHQSSTVHNHDVSIIDSDLFSRIKRRLTWDQVSCTSPTLSLTNDDDDVVYMMGNAKLENRISLVLAVNARDKMLEALEECCAEKMICLEPTYVASDFSSYLDTNVGM